MNILRQFVTPPGPALSPAEARARLQGATPPFILDVREPVEFRAFRLGGAVLIPLGQVPSHLDELPREREILVLCLSGHRSETAVRQLQAAGFKAVGLAGGLQAWRAAGLPLETGPDH